MLEFYKITNRIVLIFDKFIVYMILFSWELKMKGKYVNEENHQKIKGKLKTAGKILLSVGIVISITGIILLILGFANFGDFSSNNDMVMFIVGGFLFAIGFAMLGIGIYATFFAHAREIGSYTASSVAPVLKETTEYIAPAVNKSVGNLAESISEGIASGKAKGKDEAITCKKCGEKNEKGSKFCSKCGKSIETEKVCSNCGKKIENNDNFCPHCGQKQ